MTGQIWAERLPNGDDLAEGPPTGFQDVFEAARRAFLTGETIGSRHADLAGVDAKNDAIFKATGVRLSNPVEHRPFGAPPGMGGQLALMDMEARYHEAVKTYQSQLLALAERYPQHRDLIAPHQTIADLGMLTAHEDEARLASVRARGAWGTSFLAMLAGGVAGSFQDLPSALVNFAGFGAGAGRSLVVHALKAGTYNAGVEATLQPLVQASRAQKGLPYGLTRAAESVAGAFAFGATLDVVGRGGLRTARVLRGGRWIEPPSPTIAAPRDAPSNRGDEILAPVDTEPQPIQRPIQRPVDDLDGGEPSLERAIAELPERHPVRQAAEGRPEALAHAIEQLGDQAPPHLRGLAQRVDDELIFAPPTGLDDDAGWLRRAAQRLRHDLDPDTEPPALGTSELTADARALVESRQLPPPLAELVADIMPSQRQVEALEHFASRRPRTPDEARAAMAEMLDRPLPPRETVARLERRGEDALRGLADADRALTRHVEATRAIAEALNFGRRILPAGVELRVEPGELRDPRSGQLLDGASDVTTGDVTLAATALDPLGIVGHEAVHALVTRGVISPAELRVLATAADRAGVFPDDLKARYAEAYRGRANPDQLLLEEAAAHLIEAGLRGDVTLTRQVERIIARIRQFLEQMAERLRNYGQGAGFQTADELIAAIVRGDVGQRQPRPAWRRDGADSAGDLMAAVRAPWRDFPPVDTLHPLNVLQGTDRALYEQAKRADDWTAALTLVRRLIDQAALDRVAAAVAGRDAIVVPIRAVEGASTNALPKAYADELADRLGLTVDEGIVQTVRASHTGASAFERMVRQPEFTGPVAAGRAYVIVDDMMAVGGSLAGLRGYIESQGGHVVYATTLARSRQRGGERSPLRPLAPSRKQLRALKRKIPQLEAWWHHEFGYPLEQITAGELAHLRQAGSFDAIRDRVAAAKRAGGPQGDEGDSGPSAARGGGGPGQGGRGQDGRRPGGRGPGDPDPDLMFALADRQTGRSMRRALDSFGFYSHALEAARGLKQAKGAPEQLLAQLKAAGVKDAELKATGLRQAVQGRRSVTREQIVSHLEQNQVQLRQTVLEHKGEPVAVDLEPLDTTARWFNFALDPDNPTYRETLLHLPAAEPVPHPTVRDAYALQGPDGSYLSDRGQPVIIADPSDAPAKARRVQFHSSHFLQPNIVGHMMTSLTFHEGRVVFTVDQIQSDWGQKLRKLGKGDEARVEELRRQLVGSADALAGVKTIMREIEDQIFEHTMIIEKGPGLLRRKKFIERLKSEVVELRRLLQAWHEKQLEHRRIYAELVKEQGKPKVSHPLVETTDQWVSTVLRRAIRQAAESRAEFIAIPSGETVLSYNPGDTHGMKAFYNSIVPKSLRQLLRRLDQKSGSPIKVETLASPSGKTDLGQGFTLFELTDQVKQRVLDEGQPLFALADRHADTAAAAEPELPPVRGSPDFDQPLGAGAAAQIEALSRDIDALRLSTELSDELAAAEADEFGARLVEACQLGRAA